MPAEADLVSYAQLNSSSYSHHDKDREHLLPGSSGHHTKPSDGIVIFGTRIPSLLPHGGLASSGFNLASATLGAGTLALPSAMQASGWVITLIFLVICALATLYTIRLLAVTADHTGLMSFEEMSRVLLGSRRWEYFTEFVMVTFCWGITVVYIVAIGQVIQPLQQIEGMPLAFQGTNGNRLLTSMFWGVFMLPLSLAKEISTLRFASAVGILSTITLVCAVVDHAVEFGTQTIGSLMPARFGVSMVESLPIVMFAFTCQTNAFEIYSELFPRTVKRMTLSSSICLLLCTSIYAVCGLAGYADFGDNVDSNILNNYTDPLQHPLLAAAFACISVTLTMAFPVCIFPCRDAILHLLGYKDAYSTPTKVRILICAALAAASLVTGLYAPNIKTLFGLLGGAFGSIIGFIFPPVFAILSRPWTPKTVGWFHFLVTYAILVFGIIAGVLGTVVSIIQM